MIRRAGLALLGLLFAGAVAELVVGAVPALARADSARIYESGLPLSGGTLSGTLVQSSGRIYNSAGPLNLGTSAATTNSLASGDVLVGGELEVDGILYADGGLWTNEFRLSSAIVLSVSGNDTRLGTNAALQNVIVHAGGGQKFTMRTDGGFQFVNGAGKPTCNSSARGTIYYTSSAAGVKDAFEVCAKDAADSYAWRTIY